MRVYLKKSHFKDGEWCCLNSLFERGKRIEGTAVDDMAVDDWAYLDFQVKWKFSKGFEGPMAVINYLELHIQHPDDSDWTIIDSKGDYFKDNPVHYPVSPNEEFFAAMSLNRSKIDESKDWNYFLWIFKRKQSTWKLVKKIEVDTWFRIMQFSPNNQELLVYSYLNIFLVDLVTFQKTSLFKIPPQTKAPPFFSNTHYSNDGKYIIAVYITENEKTEYHLLDIKSKKSAILKRGMNTIGIPIPKELIFPLLVDTGTVTITISQK